MVIDESAQFFHKHTKVELAHRCGHCRELLVFAGSVREAKQVAFAHQLLQSLDKVDVGEVCPRIFHVSEALEAAETYYRTGTVQLDAPFWRRNLEASHARLPRQLRWEPP